MIEPLSYLELIDAGGYAVVADGMATVIGGAVSPAPSASGSAWVRLFHRESSSDGLSFGSLLTLMQAVPSVLEGLIRCLERGETVRFGAFDTATRGFTTVESSSATSIDQALAVWDRMVDRYDVLVAFDAPVASITTMLVDVQRGDPPPAPPPMPDTCATRRLREELSADWMGAGAVGATLNSHAKNTSQLACRYRKAGRLFGVWVRARNCYLFPPWQFRNGQILPEIQEMLALLRGPHGIAGDWDRSGWDEMGWFYAPHRLLEGWRPVDLIERDPDQVLEAARREFKDGIDARW